MLTCAVLIKPLPLLVCLTVLCAALLAAICIVSILIVKQYKKRGNTTQNLVNTDKIYAKSVDCDNKQCQNAEVSVKSDMREDSEE